MEWIELIWLMIGTSGGLLWTRYWTFGLHKMLVGSRGAAQLAAPQEGLSSVSKYSYVSELLFRKKYIYCANRNLVRYHDKQTCRAELHFISLLDDVYISHPSNECSMPRSSKWRKRMYEAPTCCSSLDLPFLLYLKSKFSAQYSVIHIHTKLMEIILRTLRLGLQIIVKWGNEGRAARILDLGNRWRWVLSFTTRPLYPQENCSQYPFDRKIGGPQSRSGLCEGGKMLPLTGFETLPSSP
jgi:hypothetical protein